MLVRTLAAVCVAVLVAPGGALAGTTMFVGAAEDQAQSVDPVAAKAHMDLAALAGLDAIRMTSVWTPGDTEITGNRLAILENAAVAAQLDGIRLIVSVYHKNQRTTPLTPLARSQFAAYAASIAQKVPAIRDLIIGNEPNLNLFWMPQFDSRGRDAAAIAYEKLLAQTYDAIKAVAPDANVIGGAVSPRGQDKRFALRQTHSPTRFIPDLGDAYRKSGRRKRIMDMFAFHPYLIPSKLPPTFKNPRGTTIALSDYDKLVGLLDRAFRGTAQPGKGLPIVYDEFGYQSQIPVAKRGFYRNLGTTAARDAIPEKKQAQFYRQAFAIAQCQPTVAGMLIFHVVDEDDANAWQSGVYYADGTPKASMEAVRTAALLAQTGSLVGCKRQKVGSGVGPITFRDPLLDAPKALTVDFACTVVCRYAARVLRIDTGEVALESSGTAPVGQQTLTLPADALPPGSYQYSFRASAAGKSGNAVTRYSRPFDIPVPPAPETPPTDDPGSGTPQAADPAPPPDADAAPAFVPLPPILSSLPFLPTLQPIMPRQQPTAVSTPSPH
jgi:hypothetical protein